MTATGYEPLNTLKPVADSIWVIDGPACRYCGIPFPTRATVIRLEDGALWVHSPTVLTDALLSEMTAVGSVGHIIAPSPMHFVNLHTWLQAFPDAEYWAVEGVQEKAAKSGIDLARGRALQSDHAEAVWAGQLEQIIPRGLPDHHEAVFFHRPSDTLVLTDLVASLETAYLPVWVRPLVWLLGVDDSDGKMPPDLRWGVKDKEAFADDIERMLGWGPRRVILSHGRWYERDGVAELERAFRRFLRDRRWEKALSKVQDRK